MKPEKVEMWRTRDGQVCENEVAALLVNAVLTYKEYEAARTGAKDRWLERRQFEEALWALAEYVTAHVKKPVQKPVEEAVE